VRAAPSTAELRYKLATFLFYRAAARLKTALDAKTNFDPNQPRIPRGSSEGGRWTRVGGTSRESLMRLASNEPPTIPPIRPPTGRERNAVVKRVAAYLLRMGARLTPIGRVLDILDAALWLCDFTPYIEAYLDEPKSLQELQRNVSGPKRGYDIHHIVEQTPAAKDGFPRSMIDAPENLVRIPTLKHWQINGWFSTPNRRFGGLSPRDYLRGKDWQERVRIGRDALIYFGVLRP
jgi:hypothetical protein